MVAQVKAAFLPKASLIVNTGSDNWYYYKT